ncbi:MAG: DUF2905 domain-containing protein [Acidobacteriaceae bacterium]|nr:DUF2905 domain-containing protein [Acidobacteriaceae bacterium]
MSIGRLLVFAGLAIAVLGAVLMLGERANLPFGRLPGDIVWRGRNSTVYFPWVTCLILSVVASLVLWLIGRLR